MIKKEMLELLFDAASIQRWNDHIRPGKGFTELDKQAHKMFFAYVLAKFEESDRKVQIDWAGLIEGGIFEFLHRIVLTDIKPPIYHKLMEKMGDRLNKWVFEVLNGSIEGIRGGFRQNFFRYFTDPDYLSLERKILKASHYLATNWEFEIIYDLNKNIIYGLDLTREEIENEIEEHIDLIGVQKLGLGKKTKNFLDLVGQLRFQQRWSHSPRVPETSVLGHMLVVAILSFFGTLEIEGCDRRKVNNFFGGLFHDLPEVLTRDIISPVKNSVEGLEKIIKDIEKIQVDEKIFPLLPIAWHKEIRYFTENEFDSKVIVDDETVITSSAEINIKYNEDAFSPLDGEIIRACDHLAAYMEAYLSISHGISSRFLKDGMEQLYNKYKSLTVGDLDFGMLFNYFQL